MRILEGDAADINAVIHGMPHPTTISYLQNAMQENAPYLADIARYHQVDMNAMFNQYYSSQALMRASQVINTISNSFSIDAIYDFYKLEEMQTAQPMMQTVIMANPMVRQYYHEQRIDGYSDSYVDMSPGKVGTEDHEFRKIIDGVIFTEDTYGIFEGKPEFDWRVRNYIAEYDEDERPYSIIEKSNIFTTWQHLEAALELNGEDPTSIFGDEMG